MEEWEADEGWGGRVFGVCLRMLTGWLAGKCHALIEMFSRLEAHLCKVQGELMPRAT